MKTLQPDIYFFNPTCEYSIANGNENWQPNRILQKMEGDLSILPMFFANSIDFILVDSIPSNEFISALNQLEIAIPKFILKRNIAKDKEFLSLSKNKLFPWGWSPKAHKLFSPIKESCSIEFRQSPVYSWLPVHKEISSRKFSAGILKQLLQGNQFDFLIPPEFAPKICQNKNDFESAINEWGKVMTKAPWSSSGRGLQKITKHPVHKKVWEKLMGIVQEQGYAVCEPLLNKVLDLALLFEMSKGKVKFLGTSYFSTDEKGQYLGNYLNGLPENIKKQILDFVHFSTNAIREPLREAIESSELATCYEGPLGVDMLVYLDKNNSLKINPCLEINVRHTMGLLSLELQKFVNQNRKGIFKIFFQPGKSFYTFSKEMAEKHPLQIRNKKIDSGFIALTEPVADSLFGSYILV
jgi:hypothetical protein